MSFIDIDDDLDEPTPAQIVVTPVVGNTESSLTTAIAAPAPSVIAPSFFASFHAAATSSDTAVDYTTLAPKSDIAAGTPTDSLAVVSREAAHISLIDSDKLRDELTSYKRRRTESRSADELVNISTTSTTLSSADESGTDFISLSMTSETPSKASVRPPSTPLPLPRPVSELPWCTRAYDHPNFSLRLHEELIDFATFISPTQYEHNQRVALLNRITALVKTIWPKAIVQPFGSFVTRLYLPNSDIDIVILNVISSKALMSLAHALAESGMASSIEVIAQARIPIIKYADAETNIRIDFSFATTHTTTNGSSTSSSSTSSGIKAAEFINNCQNEYPNLRPLILFLKYFLYIRNLHETYTGGIGSYLLQLMILSFLQLHPPHTNDINLGLCLIHFFDLYGRQLNYEHIGISVINHQNKNNINLLSSGKYFRKIDKNWFDENKPYLLSVENPLDIEHDVANNSFNIQKIRRVFDWALMVITSKNIIQSKKESRVKLNNNKNNEEDQLRHCPSILAQLIPVEELDAILIKRSKQPTITDNLSTEFQFNTLSNGVPPLSPISVATSQDDRSVSPLPMSRQERKELQMSKKKEKKNEKRKRRRELKAAQKSSATFIQEDDIDHNHDTNKVDLTLDQSHTNSNRDLSSDKIAVKKKDKRKKRKLNDLTAADDATTTETASAVDFIQVNSDDDNNDDVVELTSPTPNNQLKRQSNKKSSRKRYGRQSLATTLFGNGGGGGGRRKSSGDKPNNSIGESNRSKERRQRIVVKKKKQQ